MTPPPAAVLHVLAPPAAPAAATASVRALSSARRLRPGVPVRPDWACDNCRTPNPGRRRRCVDCGTSRL